MISTALCILHREYITSVFSSYSEANAPELLENNEVTCISTMFSTQHCSIFYTCVCYVFISVSTLPSLFYVHMTSSPIMLQITDRRHATRLKKRHMIYLPQRKYENKVVFIHVFFLIKNSFAFLSD